MIPYKFKQISAGVFFKINDINTFQLIVSNPYLIDKITPLALEDTNQDTDTLDSNTTYNICTIYNANVSRRQSGYYNLSADTRSILKRIPVSARF